MQGGGRATKHHLKHSDAANDLKERATQFYLKMYSQDCDVPDVDDAPAELEPLIRKMRDDVSQLKDTPNSLIECIKTMSQEQLEMALEIMGTKEKRGGNTEDKILKVARFAWPQVHELLKAKQIITKCLDDAMKEFLMLYGEQFHSYKNGSAQFDNDSFRDEIQKEILRREGAAAAQAVMPCPEGGRNCAVM